MEYTHLPQDQMILSETLDIDTRDILLIQQLFEA
jgi:hypothetical protein